MTKNVLRIHVLNQGHGDSIVLETASTNEDRHFALVDCHHAAPTLDYLQHLGCTRLDFVVATHAHSDHVLGLPAILAGNAEIEVRELIITLTDHPSRTWMRILDCARSMRTPMRKAGQGGEMQFGAARILVLGPSPTLVRLRAQLPDERLSENERSIVLRVDLGDSRAVLGGDAQEHCWTSVFSAFPEADLSSQVLKVAHHGSKNGSPMGSLKFIKPIYAVISAGPRRSDYHFPDASTLEALRERISADCIFSTADSLPNGEPLASVVFTTAGHRQWRTAVHAAGNLPQPLRLT